MARSRIHGEPSGEAVDRKMRPRHRRQRAEEERQSHVMVIIEFDAGDPEATMHAMADEILPPRRC
jgi:hypothetical protein